MALKSANFEFLLDERLRKVYFKTLLEIPSKIPMLYNINNSNKNIEYDYEIGDIGSVGEFNGKIDYQDIEGQYRTPYEHVEYATGIQIQRKLLDDEQYNVINKAPNCLGVAMRRRRETDGASPFINAFDAGVTYGDGQSLCAAAHTAEGVSTTWSNSGSTALSPASISATRLLMKRFTSSSDQIVEIDPDTLLIPIDLEETLTEILRSSKQLDSNNNNVNFNQDRYAKITWRYLNDTKNWFMMDSRLMKMQLNWFNRIPVEFNKDVDSDTYIRKWSTYMRYSNGASGWRFIYGHDVT